MKTFEFTYNNENYVCSMNRAMLRELESKNGLSLMNENDILNKTYILFYGALKTNRNAITYAQACDILDAITRVDEKGECEYDFVDIAKGLSAMTNECMQSGKAKNQIKIG